MEYLKNALMHNDFVITYFFINFFISGLVVGSCLNEISGKNFSIFKTFLVALLFSVAGLAMVIVFLLSILLRKIFTPLDNYFQLRFWFDYYILGDYKNMDIEVLKFLNRKAYFLKNTKSLGHKIFIKVVKLINERNNYNYNHDEVID